MRKDTFVGASLLAKNAKAPRLCRMPALSLASFASKLAPTESTPESILPIACVRQLAIANVLDFPGAVHKLDISIDHFTDIGIGFVHGKYFLHVHLLAVVIRRDDRCCIRLRHPRYSRQGKCTTEH